MANSIEERTGRTFGLPIRPSLSYGLLYSKIEHRCVKAREEGEGDRGRADGA
jgi:hypothetical protein